MKSKITFHKKWFIWAIAALFYLYETCLRVSPSVMTNELVQTFGVSSTSLGFLTSFYYYAYVPLQIPCGIVVDRVGIRLIVTTSCLLCILGTIIFGYTSNLFIAQMGRFLIGAGSACAFISCLRVTVEWFPANQFALVVGLTNMMGTIGGLCAGRPLAVLVNTLGWRQTSTYLALIGIPIAFLTWCFLVPQKALYNEPENDSLAQTLSQLYRNKQLWLIGLVGGFMYVPISVFGELWGVPFIMETQHVDNATAATICHLIFIGMAFGGPLTAWAIMKLGAIKRVMICSAYLTGILFLFIAFSQYIYLSVLALCILFAGFTVSGQVLCFTIAKNSVNRELSGSCIGFINAIVMMSGVVFQPLLGYVIDVFGNGRSSFGVKIYSADAYQMAILVIPLCFFLSALIIRQLRNSDNIVESH